MKSRDPLKEILASSLEPIPYSSHPSNAVLRDYIRGRLGRAGSFELAGLQAGSLAHWHRAEVTAHLLTCQRCAHLVAELRQELAPQKTIIRRLLPRIEPVPAFARAVIFAQFVLILGLIGVIYFKPAPFFSPLSPTAAIIPSSGMNKSSQAPQPVSPSSQPQILESPADPIPQMVQAHPLTVRIELREDTPIRELEDLMEEINGILILMRRNGFIVRLSADEKLESVMKTLWQSPYIVEARKD
ncbi:MAG: hypothetical protein RMJ29_06985 [Candidatus Bipolaricaulota bacterium]|nr:hypothetical protein [Candidatus Bipolaricaulota bacterium]